MKVGGPRTWPRLASLCDGYLNQDFVAEHGDAAAAVRAWLADAGRDAATDLSSEWRTFLNVTGGMAAAARAAALRDVAGGAWAPSDDAEFEAVSALLLDAWR